MGIVNFGIPQEETMYLKEQMGLDVFVEGGTYKGATAKSMSETFRKVYTIEKSEVMFEQAFEQLKGIPNIELLKGDTRGHLYEILRENDNLLFWLDAHWSGGDTYGAKDECPLLEELASIFEHRKNQLILIDDARLFMAPPPLPHDYRVWPTISDIVRVLPEGWELAIFEDVIYLLPISVADKFKTHLQQTVTDRWKQYGKESRAGFVKGLKRAVRGLLKK